MNSSISAPALLSPSNDPVYQRRSTVEELIQSECLYANQLKAFIRHIVQPARLILGKEEHLQVFGNIEQIAEYHSKLIDRLLTAADVDAASPSAPYVRLQAVLQVFLSVHCLPNSEISRLYRSYISFLFPSAGKFNQVPYPLVYVCRICVYMCSR